jgi:hypothetical protein
VLTEKPVNLTHDSPNPILDLGPSAVMTIKERASCP